MRVVRAKVEVPPGLINHLKGYVASRAVQLTLVKDWGPLRAFYGPEWRFWQIFGETECQSMRTYAPSSSSVRYGEGLQGVYPYLLTVDELSTPISEPERLATVMERLRRNKIYVGKPLMKKIYGALTALEKMNTYPDMLVLGLRVDSEQVVTLRTPRGNVEVRIPKATEAKVIVIEIKCGEYAELSKQEKKLKEYALSNPETYDYVIIRVKTKLMLPEQLDVTLTKFR